jgi:hypothetical protein
MALPILFTIPSIGLSGVAHKGNNSPLSGLYILRLGFFKVPENIIGINIDKCPHACACFNIITFF